MESTFLEWSGMCNVEMLLFAIACFLYISSYVQHFFVSPHP